MYRRALSIAAVSLVATTLASSASAQTPPAPTMRQVDFQTAVSEAIAKNPTIAEAATSIDRAEALLEQARAVTRPTITANFSTLTLNSSQGFEGTTTQPQSQVTANVTAAFPVLAPSRWAAINQAKDQVDVSRLTTAETRQQIGIAAAEAYLAVIAAKRQVDASERALQSARDHLDYAQKRLDGGAGTRLDMLRAAQEASSEAARLENTRLTVRQSQEALGVLLVEDGPVDAGPEPSLETEGPIDEAAWMAARPDIRAENAIIAADQRTVRDSRLDWYPNATVAFTPQTILPASLFQSPHGWALTFSFAQPLFDAGQRNATRSLREVTVSQTKLQLTSLQVQARSEIRLAQASIDSATRALAAAQQAAGQATDVLQITTQAFQVGATTNLEVIDAERSSLDAATTVAQTEDLLRRARLDLLVALGQFPR